jgi:acyl-CoA synthetase (AMP-forming)/AMP-acid ligase II
MLMFLVNHPKADQFDLRSLRRVLFAGAPVTPVVFEKAIQRFGNIFMHGFGTTETVGSISILRIDEVAAALAGGNKEILGSCGKSYDGMQAEVVEESGVPVAPGAVGEIRVRGVGTTLGYWNKPEETRKAFRDHWFYTSDLARVDDQGFIHVVGRKKDMIITGGENVFPAEVESVLYKHPAVTQSAVIGLPDETWGESVTAVIVKRSDVQVTENEIRAFCRKEIAGYKVPKKVIFLDALPLSASGKLLKNKLREQLAL